VQGSFAILAHTAAALTEMFCRELFAIDLGLRLPFECDLVGTGRRPHRDAGVEVSAPPSRRCPAKPGAACYGERAAQVRAAQARAQGWSRAA